MNTNTMTTKTALKMRKYWHTLSDLDLAVIAQLTDGDGVARNLGGGRCEIDADTAQQLADVCRCPHGAAGGFHGFIYYRETREFFAANRAEIVAAIRDQIDQGLWSDDSGASVSVVGAVMKFNALKGEDPAEMEEAVARAIFGPLDDVRAGHLDVIANPCAWGALEDLAFGLDGQEIEDDETDNDSEEA